MSTHESRVRAHECQRRIQNENIFQYSALGGVSVWLGASILLFKPAVVIQVALGLLIAGAVVIGYRDYPM